MALSRAGRGFAGARGEGGWRWTVGEAIWEGRYAPVAAAPRITRPPLPPKFLKMNLRQENERDSIRAPQKKRPRLEYLLPSGARVPAARGAGAVGRRDSRGSGAKAC